MDSDIVVVAISSGWKHIVNLRFGEILDHFLREKTTVEDQNLSFDIHLFNCVGKRLDVLYTSRNRPYHCRKAGVCAAEKCKIYLRKIYFVFIIALLRLMYAHRSREGGAQVVDELLAMVENSLEHDILPFSIHTNRS